MRIDGGGGGGDYSAIDVERLEQMIGSLTDAAEHLQSRSSLLRSRGAFWAIGDAELREIERIGQWAEHEVPGLRRRLNLAKAIERQSANFGTVYLSEPVLTADEAGRKGRALARRLLEHNRTDDENAALMHDVADDLGAYSDDPDVMSAFFAELGPQYTQAIPMLMAGSGSGTAREDLEAYSRALGVATLDTDPSSGFVAVQNAFTAVPQEGRLPPSTGWNRLAMVQYGDYPREWLTEVVRVNALDSFAEDPDQDFRGGATSTVMATGLSDSTLALAFSALADQSGAARDALTSMGGPEHDISVEELTDRVYGLAESRGTGDDVADSFGLAVEAGAGVHDEQAGRHSPAAAALAQQFIVASADHADPSWTVKDSLSRVATSYSHEMVVSSNTEPGYSVDVPGLTPSFTVSSADVYGFLRGFAGDDRFTDPFDTEMGRLYHDTLAAAGRADHEDITSGRTDLERFEFATGLFGDLAGLEYRAKEQVRGDMDERDKQFASMFKDIVTFPLGFVPGDQYIRQGLSLGADGAKIVWNVAQYGAGKGLDAALETDAEDTRVGALESEEHAMVLSHRYVVAQALLDADYEHTPMPSSVGHDDRLHDFDDVDPHAFQEWLSRNDGPGSFASKVSQGDRMFLGGNYKAQHVAQTYEEAHE